MSPPRARFGSIRRTCAGDSSGPQSSSPEVTWSGQSAADVVGPDFVRAGDASVRLDPLSSQGVQSALVSGVQAAAVVNTLARHSEHREAALAFYRDRQREHGARHTGKTAGLYRERWSVCPRPFWEQRAAVLDRQASDTEAYGQSSSQAAASMERPALDVTWTIGLSPRARIWSTPAMNDDVIRLVPAVHHDVWERPVAFVDGVCVTPLLALIRSGQRATAIVDSWSTHLPRESRFSSAVIRIIQLVLGHSDIKMTQRYLNITDEELRKTLTGVWERRWSFLRIWLASRSSFSAYAKAPAGQPSRVTSRAKDLVRPARLERATSWFVARRSIQLSYGR